MRDSRGWSRSRSGWICAVAGMLLSCGHESRPTRDAEVADASHVQSSSGVAGTKSAGAEPVAAAAEALSVTPTCYGAPGLQAQAPWPMVGLCPMHRGQSVAVAAQTNVRAWANPVGLSAMVRGSAAVSSDGTIYVGSSSGLFRRNSDGTAKWTSAATPGIGLGASPAIGADGTIYYVTTGSSSIVRALTPGTTAPTQKWATTSTVFGGTASSGPVLSADGATVYASSQNGKLLALRTAIEGSNAAGSPRWTFRTNATTPSPLWTSPAIGVDGTLYIGADNGLYAVDPATGIQVTSKSFTTGSPVVRSNPAVGPDGTVYFGTGMGTTASLGLVAVKNGVQQWKWPSSGTAPVIVSSPAVGGDGTIYFGTRTIASPSTPGKVMALNPNGTVKWSLSVGTNNVDASPAIGADGTVYVGADDKKVYALRDNGTATPATVFSFTLGTGSALVVRSALAISRNGTVYVTTDDTSQTLWAFGPGTCGASDTSCDGTDNNCNGSVDEAYAPVATNCGVGACARTGTSSCVIGVVQQNCTAGTPAASDTTCDNIDDNCNGTKDEGYVPVGTNCGVGACARTGTSSCVSGAVQQNCTAGTPAASDTTCNNVDDNCNGTKDEGYVSVGTNCGVGACARTGTSSCVSGAVQQNCTAGTPAASDTTCNGVDDNCSGSTDEGYVSQSTSCGVGACARTGTTSCTAGVVSDSCAPGTPASSTDATCDGADDNCNGIADEGYVSVHTTCGTGATSSTGQTSCVNGIVRNSCIPGAGTFWTHIATSSVHGCGLRGGALWCWGNYVHATVAIDPVQVGTDTDWTMVAAGGDRITCAIRQGQLYCFGTNTAATVSPWPDIQWSETPVRIGGDSDWTTISVGMNFVCGVRSGQLYCWGDNEGGQLGNGAQYQGPNATPTRVGTDNGWTWVSAGYADTCGTQAGKLYCWGNNSDGQLGLGDTVSRLTPARVGTDSDWSQVDASARNTCGVRAGKLYCSGVGPGTVFRQQGTRTDWQLVTVGRDYACGVAGGGLYCEGVNDQYQLGTGDHTEYLDWGSPEWPRIGNASDWTTVSTEYSFSPFVCGLHSGSRYCWGKNDSNQFGDGTTTNQVTPARVDCDVASYVSRTTTCGVGGCLRSGATSCVNGMVQDGCTPGTPAASDTTCNAIDDNCNGSTDEGYVSQATTCGTGACARTGATSCVGGAINDSCAPGTPASSTDATCNGVDDNCNGVTDEGYVALHTTCGSGTSSSSGQTSCVSGVVSNSCTPGAGQQWTKIATGSGNGCGIRGGALRCWGLYYASNTVVSPEPVQIGTDTDWTSVAGGGDSFCAIRQGQLYCLGTWWGASPFRIGTDNDWTSVSVQRENAVCGIRKGELYCMPSTNPPDPTLTQIGTDNDWTWVSIGYFNACAIRGGKLYCWGKNSYGELGLGDTVEHTSPTRVGSDSDWSKISAEYSNSCGIRSGKLYCTGDRSGPLFRQQGTRSDWQSITAGQGYACGIASGELHCEGANDHGQLGTGDGLNYLDWGPSEWPKIGTATDWTAVSTTFSYGPFTCGLRSGARYCWGRNDFANFGDGTTVSRKVPTPADAPPPVMGARLWLNPSTISPSTVGSEVETWSDSDGSGVTFGSNLRPVAPPRPTLVPGLGGQPAVHFSGGQYMHAWLGDTSGWQGMTLIAVLKSPSTLPQYGTILGSGGDRQPYWAMPTSGDRWAAGLGTDPVQGIGWFGDDPNIWDPGTGLGTANVSPDTPYVLVWKRGKGAGSGWIIRKNGIPLTAQPSVDPAFFTGKFSAFLGTEGLDWGGGIQRPGSFDLSELMVYNRELPDAESATIEQDVGGRYGITLGCTSASPCTSGQSGCTSDADCAPGLSCGFGIGPRFGQPADVGVCWDARECATLGTTDCGAPTSKCGTTCCLQNCGAAGTPDGCGGTCQACAPGADSDGDGLLDCDERTDASAWTDPLIFNGVTAQRGNACNATPSCPDIATYQQANACFSSLESTRLDSGWDFDTSNTNLCQSGFGFDPPWQGCGTNFAVHYQGAIRLEQTGQHCFSIVGSTDTQCGALFFNQASDAQTTGQTAVCYTISAGIYPIEWFYETANASSNALHVDYCFGGNAACTPTQAIPNNMLRTADDAQSRICAADSACSELCPCDAGGICTNDSLCMSGRCRTDVADRYGQPAGTGVCWDSICDDWQSPLFECGSTTSRCGLCPPCTTNCVATGKSCGYDGCWGSCGDVCQQGQLGCTKNGDCAPGLECAISSSGPNVCLPDICGHPGMNPCSNLANAGQMTECGQCPPCASNCGVRVCGTSPNGCGTCDNFTLGPTEKCTNEGNIESRVTLGIAVPNQDISVGVDTPGTLPGQFAVSDFGQATYTIPIQVAPGRNGIEPNLALHYDSSAGNGYLGMGWGLTGLSAIQRCPKTIAQDGAVAGITYTQDDRFCLDGNRLVLADTNGTYGADGTKYRTEIETFSQIISDGSGGEPTKFRVFAKDGRILTYDTVVGGNTPLTGTGVRNPNFSLGSPPGQLRTQSWLLTKVEDRFHNSMEIQYKVIRYTSSFGHFLGLPDTISEVLGGAAREYYPLRINYTIHRDDSDQTDLDSDRYVEFTYRPRRDILSGYQYGTRYERTQLLEKITSYANGEFVFKYMLGYDEPAAGTDGLAAPDQIHDRTRLTSVTQCAAQLATGRPLATDPDPPVTCKPPTRFDYDQVARGFTTDVNVPAPDLDNVADIDADFVGSSLTLDLDGNGQDDVLYSHCSAFSQSSPSVCENLEWKMLLNGVPASSGDYHDKQRMISRVSGTISPSATFAMDYDLDGHDDVLEIDVAHRKEKNGEIRRWSLVNGQLTELGTGIFLGDPTDGGNIYVLDANGDGANDLVVCTPMYEIGQNRGFVTSRRVVGHTWELRLHDRVSGFGSGVQLTSQGPACQEASVIDINGDGKHELLLNTSPFVHTGLTVVPGDARGQSSYFIQNDASAIFWPLTGQATETALPATRKNAVRLMLDVNGDGVADVAEISDDFHVTLWHGTGSGFVSYESAIGLSPTVSSPYSGGNFLRQLARLGTAFDENGDGRTDLIVRANDSTWVLLRSQGTSFSVHSLSVTGPAGGNRFFVYDANHDGMSDLVIDNNVYLRAGASVQRLNAITDGLSGHIAVDYAALNQNPGTDNFDSLPQGPVYTHSTSGCGYPVYCRYPAGSVVRRHRIWKTANFSGFPAARSFFYSYSDAAMDLQGRGSLGFGTRRVTDGARHAIAVEAGGEQLSIITYPNKFRDLTLNIYPFVGREQARIDVTTTTAGRSHASTVFQYLCPGLDDSCESFADYPSPHSIFPHAIREWQIVGESPPNGTDPDILTNVTYKQQYDSYGNVTRADTQFTDGNNTSQVTTYLVTEDQAYTSRWLISQPRRRTVTGTGNSSPVRTQRFRYAEDGDGSANLTFKGRPEAVIIEPEQVSQKLVKSFTYNAFGNVTDVSSSGATLTETGATVQQTRRTGITYDAAQMFPVKVTEHTGELSDDVTHDVTFDYDQGLGIVIHSQEDGHFDIPVQHFTVPDGFGRPRRVQEPDGMFTDIVYETPAVGALSVQTTRFGAPSQTTTYDVLGRESEREIQGFNGDLFFVDTQYNALGLVSTVSRLHNNAAPDADFTQFSYDSLGRRLVTTLPDNNTVQNCYFGNVACTRNPRGFTNCEVVNGHGQLVHSVQPDANATSEDCDVVAGRVAQDFPAEGDPANPSVHNANHYRYDPFGAVLSIADPAHNTTVYNRDAYGRPVVEANPDSGLWISSYNAFGELQTQIDPQNQGALFRYDGLGRMVSRIDAMGGAPNQVTHWTYDFLFGAGFFGKLLSTSTPDGVVTVTTFDDFGRPTDMSRSIPGEVSSPTLTRHQEYAPDGTGRIDFVAYDNGTPNTQPLRVRYNYTQSGYLQGLSRPTPNPDGTVQAPPNDTEYWTAQATDPYGQLTSELFHNGLLTGRTYKPHTGHLDLLCTRPGSSDCAAQASNEVQHWQHGYDENGNLKTRGDQRSDGGLAYTTYTYDALDRMNDATTYINLFVLSRQETYVYDEIGNITHKSVTDPSVGSPYSWTYGYGAAGPHAVQSITDDNDANIGQTYHYTPSGELDTRAVAPTRTAGMQPQLSMSYNRIHMPSRIGSTLTSTDGVAIDYDSFGTRVRKASNANGETFYLDDNYSVTRAAGTSGLTERLVVAAGSHAVAEVVRDPGGTESTSYLHEDHLGSVEVVTIDAGTPVQRRDYEAFGKRRSVTGSNLALATRGDYTGHELDAEFGLVNMKARMYDPMIGRFLAPDPITAEPWHGQGLNPYSYVLNSPVNFVDPLGLQEVGGGGVGGGLGGGGGHNPGPPGEPPLCDWWCQRGREFEQWDIWHDRGWRWTKDVGHFFGWGQPPPPPKREASKTFSAPTETSTSIAPHADTGSAGPTGQPTSPVSPSVAPHPSGAQGARSGVQLTEEQQRALRMLDVADIIDTTFEAIDKGITVADFAVGTHGLLGGLKVVGKETAEFAAREALEAGARSAARAGGEARFVVTESGVAIPTNLAELRSNLSQLTEASTNPATSRKFVGTDSQGPLRVRVEKAHPPDPNFQGTPDPLHTVDHLHIDRRANGQTGSWGSAEKVPYAWPF